MRVLGNAGSAYQLGQTQIALGGGRTIKLADIADVRDLYGEQRSYSTHERPPGAELQLLARQGPVRRHRLRRRDRSRLHQIEKDNPKVHFAELNNSVDYTKKQYTSAMEALIEGAVLAVLVVFLFLRDWRATVISALAIPLSAIPTFWFMDLLGFTLNGMTLLALSLVAGVLVDDAIVEIENIVRHMRMGKSAYQASIDAADEIGLAVVATTISIVAVFLPVGLMPGIAGQFFKNFGFTVVASVLISLAVARLITPMVAAYFLKAHGHASMAKAGDGPLYRRCCTGRSRNRWNDGRSPASLALGLHRSSCSRSLPHDLPAAEQRRAQRWSTSSMAPGTTLAQTERVADEVERDPAHRSPRSSRSPQRRPRRHRQRRRDAAARNASRTSIEFERALAPLLAPDPRRAGQLPVAEWRRRRPRPRRHAGRRRSRRAQRRPRTSSSQQMATLPELRAPRISGDLQRPGDHRSSRGSTSPPNSASRTAALSQTIRIATLGDIEQNSAKFSLSDRQIPIRVSLGEDARQRPLDASRTCRCRPRAAARCR